MKKLYLHDGRASLVMGRSRFAVFAAVSLFAITAWAAVSGSISGTLKDPSGAIVPGARLTATNTAIGTEYKATTDERGFYSFPSLAVGKYDVVVDAAGFKPYRRTGLTVDADSALQVDATIEMGEHT